MGLDIHAAASWGIKTTYGTIKAAYVETREWIGPKDGDRSFDFNPKTGKPNYKVSSNPPPELARWGIGLSAYEEDSSSSGDERIIIFETFRTPSHRHDISAVRVSGLRPEELTALDSRYSASGVRFTTFKTDMTKLGLWNEENFGLWLYIDASY